MRGRGRLGAAPQLAAVAAALLCALALGQPTANHNTYPIDWAAVPGAQGPKDLTSNCICDVTLNACDPSCCCDPFCPASLLNETLVEGRCLPEGPPDQTLDYCVPDISVQKVNLPSTTDFFFITVQAPDNSFIDQLLCIIDSSNPNLGDQYADPPAGDAGSNAQQAACPALPVEPSRGAFYQPNSPIYVRKPAPAGSNTTQRSQPLTIPYAAFTMTCNDDFQPGFLFPVPNAQSSVFAQCDRLTQDLTTVATTFRAACEDTTGPLSARSFTDLAFLPVPPDSTTTAVPVTLTSQYLNASGMIVPTTALDTRYNSTTGLCENALTSINITFVYNTDNATAVAGTVVNGSTIVGVQMAVLLSDLSKDAPVFQQSARVDFVEIQGTTVPIVQQLSGNPGYLSGFPLMTGLKTTYTSAATGALVALSRLTYGFPVLSGSAPGGGACSARSLTAARFGFNLTSTCTHSLDLPSLETLCKAGNSTVLLAGYLDGFWGNLTNSLVYVGQWGNSDSNAIGQWVQATQSNNQFSPPIYFDSEKACDGMVVGFDVQIVYGVAFSSNNVQRKVLYANVCYRTAKWTFPTGADSATRVAFPMTSTVSFVPIDQTAVYTQKPHPPLAIPLSANIFYPFVTSGAEGAAAPAGRGALAAGMAVVVAIGLLWMGSL